MLQCLRIVFETALLTWEGIRDVRRIPGKSVGPKPMNRFERIKDSCDRAYANLDTSNDTETPKHRGPVASLRACARAGFD
jgi:hypothetical protein